MYGTADAKGHIQAGGNQNKFTLTQNLYSDIVCFWKIWYVLQLPTNLLAVLFLNFVVSIWNLFLSLMVHQRRVKCCSLTLNADLQSCMIAEYPREGCHKFLFYIISGIIFLFAAMHFVGPLWIYSQS